MVVMVLIIVPIPPFPTNQRQGRGVGNLKGPAQERRPSAVRA